MLVGNSPLEDMFFGSVACIGCCTKVSGEGDRFEEESGTPAHGHPSSDPDPQPCALGIDDRPNGYGQNSHTRSQSSPFSIVTIVMGSDRFPRQLMGFKLEAIADKFFFFSSSKRSHPR